MFNRLSYKLTHLYYNWPGTVRVPAPCQVRNKVVAIDAASFRQLHTVPAVQQEFAAHRFCHCSLCFLYFLNTHLLFLFFILRWCNFSPRVFYFVVDSSNSWQRGWKSYFEYQRYEIINWRLFLLILLIRPDPWKLFLML